MIDFKLFIISRIDLFRVLILYDLMLRTDALGTTNTFIVMAFGLFKVFTYICYNYTRTIEIF